MKKTLVLFVAATVLSLSIFAFQAGGANALQLFGNAKVGVEARADADSSANVLAENTLSLGSFFQSMKALFVSSDVKTSAESGSESDARADVRAQNGSNSNSKRYDICAMPSMSVGTRGSAVIELQAALAELGLMSRSHITGYFGPITQSAANSYRLRCPRAEVTLYGYLEESGPSMVMWGTHVLHITGGLADAYVWPDSYVRVKAQNSAVLNKLQAYENTEVKISGHMRNFDLDNLEGGFWGLVATNVRQIPSQAADESPVIDEISGPTQLQVGESGTWKISVHDDGRYLSYAVLWGELQLEALSTKLDARVSTNSTFSHAYRMPGTYTVSITVTDEAGQTATATTEVKVLANIR